MRSRPSLLASVIPDATEADIRRVSARLAAAGWPLAGVSHPAL
ncbi:hypothetical protein [Mycobacterium sp.]